LQRFIIIGLVTAMLFLVSASVMAENSWGVGAGMPYGISGANLDLKATSLLDFSFGLGVDPLSGFAYSLGGKFYLAPEEKSFRPRISCYYGTNTDVEEDFNDYTSYAGVTMGVGAYISWGRTHQHGVDVDLMYMISTEADLDRLEADGYDTSDTKNIKISVGYRRRF